jgi:polyhydroxyalkanoate synthesis regulator protein
MEYLGEELLRNPPLHNEQIDCETTLDPVQAKQIRPTMKSILQTWVDLMEHKNIQTIMRMYDEYASSKKWHCMRDAISADLEKVKKIERALLQKCKAWRFDRK